MLKQLNMFVLGWQFLCAFRVWFLWVVPPIVVFLFGVLFHECSQVLITCQPMFMQTDSKKLGIPYVRPLSLWKECYLFNEFGASFILGFIVFKHV